MSPPSDPPDWPPDLVVVVDTGSFIAFKKLVAIADQWPLGLCMSRLLDEGRLCYPRRVVSEMAGVAYPDMPGAWVASHAGSLRHASPSDDAVAEVMGRAQLVDLDAEVEPADPYVVAMALEVRARLGEECRVVVATSDRVDRMPRRESVATACDRFGLESWTPEQFVDWVREQNA